MQRTMVAHCWEGAPSFYNQSQGVYTALVQRDSGENSIARRAVGRCSFTRLKTAVARQHQLRLAEGVNVGGVDVKHNSGGWRPD